MKTLQTNTERGFHAVRVTAPDNATAAGAYTTKKGARTVAAREAEWASRHLPGVEVDVLEGHMVDQVRRAWVVVYLHPEEDTPPQTEAKAQPEPEPEPEEATDPLSQVASGLDRLEDLLGRHLDALAEKADTGDLAFMAAEMQDARRRLTQLEGLVARAAGQARHERHGDLPGGGVYDLRRGTIRKTWDHDGWKSTVLNRVLDRHQVGDQVVNTETGEPVDVAAIVQDVQAAHGSTSPKVSVLKDLDIDPNDYCEHTPGPWTFQVTR